MARVPRFVFLLVLLVVFAGSGAAITSYNISVEDETAYVNVSFELYTSSPDETVTHWRTSWSTPPNSEILHMEDTRGEIEEYSFDGRTIEFETNPHPRPQTKEVVDIQFVTDNIVSSEYGELKRIQLQLSGFPDRRDDVPDQVTQATVYVDERILTSSQTPGFDHLLEEHRAVYDGEGPLNLHMAISDGGVTYENYVRFGEGNLSEPDDLYWLAPAFTGYDPQQNKYPVVILPDSEYDADIDRWSAGQYRTGGLILIRESMMDDDSMPAILLHETLHGINEQALRWSDSRVMWFDEGTAKYLESVVNHERGVKTPELFGERKTWRDGRHQYTLPPRGTPDQLWEYYENDEDRMYDWSPRNAETHEKRVFGYAFGELIIRLYVEEHGFDALHDVYSELREKDGDSAGTAKEETETVLSLMGTDFTPCYNEQDPDREAFETCLAEMNAFELEAPETVTIDDTTREIEIQPVERPEPADHMVSRLQSDEPLEDVLLDLLHEIGYHITTFFNNLFKRL